MRSTHFTVLSNVFFAKEKYLNFTVSPELRSSLTKMRCGNNYLPINFFRYRSAYGSSNQCFLCKTKLEDELHALTECSSLVDFRDKFFREMDTNFPHLQSIISLA